MPITLNHTIVPCHDNVESAQFYADTFGFEYRGQYGHFAVVTINDTLAFDFATKKPEHILSTHYAFKVKVCARSMM